MTDGESGFQVSDDAPAQYQEHVGVFMRPFVDALVAAVVRPGDAVLDVACGTGFVTRASADASGPSGRVAGLDINGGMLAAARGVPHAWPGAVEWHEASALDLPMEDGTYDVVVCQQGLQFTPDPAAALAEMARVTRAGGRIGVTVWGPLADSPYLNSQLNMLAGVGGIDAQSMAQAFPPGGRVTLHGWFARASLPGVEIRTIAPMVTLPPAGAYFAAHLRALPWSAPFFALDETSRDRALAEMAETLAPFAKDDGCFEVPFVAHLATVTA